MTIQMILAVLSLVSTNSLVYTKHISLRDEGVIRDYDRPWHTSYIAHEFNDPAENERRSNNYKVCHTKECKQVAEEFLRSINKSVNPCEHFYEFACGGWSENDSIPPNEVSWNRFMIFQNVVNHRLKGLLEAKPDPIDIRPVRQAKKWYRSCMNIDKLERSGMKSIASILTQAGGWPITMDENEWNGEDNPWQKVELHYVRLTGAHTLYTMNPYPSYKQGFIRIQSPDIPLTDLLQEYRNYSGNYFNVYLRLIEKTANLFVQNDRSSKEKISKEAREIVEFEKKMYELKGNSELCVWTFDALVRKFDTNWSDWLFGDPKTKIDWRSLIQGLHNILSTKMISTDRIWVTDCGYFKGLGELLERTPARTIVNYIHWNFVAKMLPYTTEWARNELFEIVHKEHGVKERSPRWSECVNNMKMSHAAAYAFVDKYFSKSTESAIQEMIKYIRIALNDQIEKSNWLNADSKEWAKDKVKNMKMEIGFPDWYRNTTELVRHYEGLTVSTDYFDNILNYMRYETKYRLQNIVEGKELDLWDIINPITVDGIYSVIYNKLGTSAADFQSPLFASQLPNNVNYGIAGFIIGHEMSHAFDNNGIYYGKGPNATSLPYSVLSNYKQIERCFSEQHVRYFGENKYAMGAKAEDIADSTSVQSAFKAYKKMSRASSDVEMRLPGLEELTDDQLFFFSFASMWCEVEKSEYGVKRIKSEMRKRFFDKEIHSPRKFRAVSAISNSEDFATVFNCPIGSLMNPVNKCNIWKT